MRKILGADSGINQKRFQEEYIQIKKYRKIVKKALKAGYDLEKMTDNQKRLFQHIESKTQAQLFPSITGRHKRSKSTLQVNVGAPSAEEDGKKQKFRHHIPPPRNHLIKASENTEEEVLSTNTSQQQHN